MNDFQEDYPKYCFEHLPDEVKRLHKQGRTGAEAFMAAESYEKRLRLKMFGGPKYQSNHSIDVNGNCNMGCC